MIGTENRVADRRQAPGCVWDEGEGEISDDSQLPDGQWSPGDCVLLVGVLTPKARGCSGVRVSVTLV